MQPPRVGMYGCFSLRLRRQCRNPSVGRVHYEGGAQSGNNLGSSIPPKVVVADSKVRLGIAIPAIPIIAFPRLLFVFGGLVRAKELFFSQLARPFQWRDRGVCPYTLQVRLIVRSSGGVPLLGRRRARLAGCSYRPHI